MNFVVIGETVERLSDEFKNTHSSVPWRLIKDFRNLIAHDYFGIDAEEVFEIIQTHLVVLDKSVTEILAD